MSFQFAGRQWSRQPWPPKTVRIKSFSTRCASWSAGDRMASRCSGFRRYTSVSVSTRPPDDSPRRRRDVDAPAQYRVSAFAASNAANHSDARLSAFV